MSLDDAFVMQHKLQVESYGIDPVELTGEARTSFITWNVLACLDELHEALDEVGWKPWATSRHVNEDAFKGELVDAFHFFMNLCLVADMGPRELLDRYYAKRAINERRQREGYDGVAGKCPGCKRAYDDPAVKCSPASELEVAWCVVKLESV